MLLQDLNDGTQDKQGKQSKSAEEQSKCIGQRTWRTSQDLILTE
jgi:hypothetical protein